MNRLLFSDNLNWLRGTKIFPDASVDLVPHSATALDRPGKIPSSPPHLS